MNKLYAIVCAMLAAALITGCAAIGVPQPQTLSQRIAVGMSGATQVRKAATILLKANRITAEDAQNVQAQADTAMAALSIARTVGSTDPAAGQEKLTSAIAILTALDAYLSSKEAAK